MSRTLSILFLEDRPADAELVEQELARVGWQVSLHRVDREGDYRAALERGGWDVILCDFTIPGFGGLQALHEARELRPGVPVIYVSGTIGEDHAIELMHSGATDYVLKNRLSRLPVAVERALREVEERAARQRADEDLHRSEEQLFHAQKMEALGRLAGEVAHDFNNLLTTILGFTELAAARLHAEDPGRVELEEVARAARRGALLTRRLLAFARKDSSKPVLLDLNAALAEAAAMFSGLLGAGIDVETHLDPATPPVRADPSQLHQVIVNLVVNARDAMGDIGVLRLSTAAVRFDDPGGLHPPGVLSAGGYAMLRIADTGSGMTPEVRSRIFEPFFTTKVKGKGTGLGLSTVYAIIAGAGGAIEVDTEGGRGTAFTIYLPEARPDDDADSGGGR